jgi:predicted nucleic acid-binding protein
VLVKWADAFQNSIGEEPATGERMACFKQMITSPRPYARVDDAWQLMETLRPIHERIVARQTRQCRKEAIAAAKVLIEKMQVHLRTHAASQDQSNRSLYALRMQKQLIEKAKTIDRIKHHRQIAEEAFETAWDEILDLG